MLTNTLTTTTILWRSICASLEREVLSSGGQEQADWFV